MSHTRELLRRLTDLFPPPEGQHHAFVLPDDGREGLDLAMRVHDECRVVHLDEADLLRSPDELAAKIAELLKQSKNYEPLPTSKTSPPIQLCYHEGPFLGLVLLGRTGLVWTNQTGGTSCLQPQAEGFYLPLEASWMPDPDPLLNGAWDYDPELVDKFLAGSEALGVLFEAPTLAEVEASEAEQGELLGYTRGKPQVCEAWVPVKVRAVPDGPVPGRPFPYSEGWDEVLGQPYAGRMGFLTYPNSD